MVKVKDRATREKNFRAAIPGVAQKYQSGIQGATGVIQAAIEGQSLYETKMRDPEVLSRRAKGLSKVSDADWKQAALAKGVQRIGAGMEAAAAKQAQNYEPYAQALSSLELAPKSADPMANIDNRVKPVVQRMLDTKKQVG